MNKSLSRRRSFHAFTLVELLVVIGIIALLISILLPVIGKARDQGVTVKCMANLRQVHMATSAYAAEHKGSLPWGFIWERPSKTAGTAAPGSARRHQNWASLLARYLNVKRDDVGIAGNYDATAYYETYSEVLRCPAVDQQFRQIVTYTPLPTAMPNIYEEYDTIKNRGGGKPLTAPAKFTDLYPDNTLFWDSPAWTALGPQHAGEHIVGNTIHGGYGGAAFSFIDNWLLGSADPTFRFRAKSGDPYFGIDPHLTQGFPIDIPSKEDYINSNSDVATVSIQYGQAGVPRFRHNRDKACNAVFTDGSVRTFVAKGFKTGGGKYYNDTNYIETEWLRKYIMIKFP